MALYNLLNIENGVLSMSVVVQVHLVINMSDIFEQRTQQFYKQYPELSEYKGNATTVHGSGEAEGKRVLCSLHLLHFLLSENKENGYTYFTKNQKPENKLSLENFEKLRSLINTTIFLFKMSTEDFVRVMEVILVIHDIFKIEEWANKATRQVDHDVMLADALKLEPTPFPSVNNLKPEERDIVKRVLSRKVNGAQILQGEGNLDSVEQMMRFFTQDPHAFNMYIVFEMLDLSGAAGHVFPVGSVVMTQDLAPVYFMFYETIKYQDYSLGNVKPSHVYRAYLKKRRDLVNLEDIYKDIPRIDEQGGMKDVVETTLSRIICSARLVHPDDGKLVLQAFSQVDFCSRTVLLFSLSDLDGPIMYFMPQLFVDRIGKKQNEEKICAIRDACIILARCFIAIHQCSISNSVYYLTDLVNGLKGQSGIPSVSVDSDGKFSIIDWDVVPENPLKRSRN